MEAVTPASTWPAATLRWIAARMNAAADEIEHRARDAGETDWPQPDALIDEMRSRVLARYY